MNQSDTNILREILELKSILARLIGTADRPEAERFSTAALDEAAKFYHQMTIERGEWAPEAQLEKYLGPCPYSPGNLMRKALAFTNWIKRRHTYLYAKQDLIALGQELKARNINLKRYQEFLADKAAFDKKAAQKSAAAARTATATAKPPTPIRTTNRRQSNEIPFNLPKGVKNSISPEEFYDRIRAIIKEQMQQDQLLTKEAAPKPCTWSPKS